MGGRYRSFEYKLTNYLIQGSAADQAKQCLLDWFKCRPEGYVFMSQVHDEINISVPDDLLFSGMELLKRCMNKEYFDVPMRSDAFTGPNWGTIKEMQE